jgi:beta-ring hydroxylase
MRRFDFELDEKFHPDGECGMTTGATIHTTNGLHVKLKRRPGTGGDEMSGSYVYGAPLSSLDDVDTISGSIDAPDTAGSDIEIKYEREAPAETTEEQLEKAKRILEREVV